MLSVLLIVLPVFALIFVGWGARRTGVLSAQASSEINRFVVWLALPALLFDIVASASWEELWQPHFIGAFGIGTAITFVAAVAFRLAKSHKLADAAIDGLNAGYANTAFLGFPLAAVALGPSGLTPTLIATVFTVCVLFGLALVMVEFGLHQGGSALATLLKVGKSLARNPLLVSPVLGALMLVFGLSIPKPLETFLDLLGGAAPPCALVALGLFLADKRPAGGGTGKGIAFLVALKLFLHPLLVWLLATRVFDLSADMTLAAVLIAALPTGTGPFMAAEFYRREAGITSRVILYSTIASLGTVTLLLALWHN